MIIGQTLVESKLLSTVRKAVHPEFAVESLGIRPMLAFDLAIVAGCRYANAMIDDIHVQ